MGALASPLVIGRYAIYGKIASGGMASVHFGRLLGAAGFSRTVAIKRLHAHLAEDPEFRSTIIDEARLAARIHHPNVVPTLDVVAAGGELLIVMEYVRGESLSRLLKAEILRGRIVPLPITSAMAVGALHGLHAAHEAKSDRGTPLGIVHRDVSPQNILLGIDGLARVIDFGVAKAAGRLQTTREGVVKGKMGYMAPEQLAAEEVTRRADVYAMSVVLWETLASMRLFQADSEPALVLKVMRGAQEPPSHHNPDVLPELDALVMKGLALDPADRFSSAREMAEELKRIAPPAFPTDVGAWVEEAASEALAARGALLEEIESSSHRAGVPPSARSGAVHTEARPETAESLHTTERDLAAPSDEVATSASQQSTLSVETSKPRVAGVPRSRRLAATVAGAVLLACAVVVALVEMLPSHGSTARVTAAPEASGSATAAAAAPPGSGAAVPVAASAPPPASASAEPAAAASITPPTQPSAQHSAVVKSPPKPAASAKPASPFRFAQPD